MLQEPGKFYRDSSQIFKPCPEFPICCTGTWRATHKLSYNWYLFLQMPSLFGCIDPVELRPTLKACSRHSHLLTRNWFFFWHWMLWNQVKTENPEGLQSFTQPWIEKVQMFYNWIIWKMFVNFLTNLIFKLGLMNLKYALNTFFFSLQISICVIQQ